MNRNLLVAGACSIASFFVLYYYIDQVRDKQHRSSVTRSSSHKTFTLDDEDDAVPHDGYDAAREAVAKELRIWCDSEEEQQLEMQLLSK